MANRHATQQLIKTYSDRRYKYATTLSHRGAIVAFAMDEERRLYYAVLDMNGPNAEASPFDVGHWPHDPSELQFPNELEQVGYSVAGATAMPLVKKGSRIEAERGSLWPEEIDRFLSTTGRLSADAPFQVYSDQKHIFIFRQAVIDNHPDAVYKLASGEASGDVTRPDADFVFDAGNKVSLVDRTLLCDRFVLSGAKLQSKREVRYRRSRHRTLPASSTDSLGAADMEGVPFFEPTQELAFIHSLKDGQFSVTQLPTEVQGVKRWQLFAYSASSKRLNSFNLEVGADGLFNTQGTQLYTSPDEEFQSAVLERQPGTCPLSGKALVPVAGKPSFAETALRLGSSGEHVRIEPEPWTADAFCVEVWVKPATTAQSEYVSAFSSSDSGSNSFQIDMQGGKWWFFQQNRDDALAIAEVKREWQHLAVSYDGVDLKVFYQGDLVGEVKREGLAINFTAYKLGVNRGSSLSFDGTLDEARVWNRARSGDEIRAYMRHRLLGEEPGLVGYWRLDEGSGSTAYDQSGRGQHGTIIGDAKWVSSDAPLGDHPGMRRSSLGVAGRTIAGGFDAQLYFQQEAAPAGYSQEEKPFKKAARVLLSVNTTAPNGEDPAMAMLDVGVARDGRLGLLPDTLNLPRLDRPEADIDINAVAEAKRNIEVARTEVERLQAQVDEYVVNTKDLPYLTEERDALQADFDAAVTVLDEPLQMRHRLRQEVLMRGSLDRLYPNDVDLCYHMSNGEIASNDLRFVIGGHGDWRFERVGEQKFKIYPEADYNFCITFVGPSEYQLEEDKGDSPDQHWILKVVAEENDWVTGELWYQYVKISSAVDTSRYISRSTPVHGQSVISRRCAPADDYYVLWRLMPGGKSKAVLAAEQTLAVQHVLEDKNRQVIALENQADELSALRAQLSARQNQLTNLQLEVAALEGGSQQDLRLEMVHLGTDPRGIARSGALLTFMGSEHPPRLHESATGRVSCYYRDVAGQLMVGYYESLVRRAQWELPTEQDPLILDSRLTRSQADQTTLVVTDGDRSETCRLTIENPTLSVREVWPELPRELADATQVLGGVHPNYDYSRATVEPADKTLRAGSLLIRPLQGPASASLVNGGAHLAHSGHCNHWIGDSPGQAYYFNGRSHHVCAPNNRLEEVGLTDDFTLELWANPLLNYESAHIVHQRGQNSGYVLGLDPALIRAALQLNGTDEFVHAAIAPWYSKSFTLELWLKPSMAEQPSAPGLFSSTEVAGANDALCLTLNADGTYLLQHATGSLTLGAAEPVWHHLAISYDGEKLRAYVDAQLVAEVEENDHTYGFQAYLLGTNVNRDTFFAGQFDELRLWSYARGLQALASERHTRMQGDEPGLHSYYRFDLTKALDLTGRAENGNYHGTPAVVTTHSALQGFRLVAGVARARGDASKRTPGTVAELQTRQFVRSREVLTQQQWNHLSMRFHQSYALEFSGQGGVKVSHNPALNLCDDLSIEVFVYLPSFTGNQTLISKGSAGMGDDQSLPFALQITGTGYLQALVEDPDGRVHTFAANQPLTPGFRRIALVRTGGSSRQTRSQSQTYSFTDSEGTEHNVPVDIVEGVDTDEWQDYVFYVDGVEFGRHRHHGEKPLGNTGPLTIGTAGLRQNLIGTLSEVRLWSVAREGKEYGRPIRGGERGLKAWWAFEEKRGNVAYERQGDYNGQLAHVRHVESPDPLGSTLDLRHNGLPLASEKLTEDSPWMAAELWGDTQFTLGGQLDEGELQIGFTGSLEEIRLWRVQRTQEQIMDNLFDRIKEEKQELLAYYSFDEDSTVLGATHLQDNGLRGLHLVWPTAEARPRASLSDAPVSQDAPSVRSALAGVHTAFHQLIDGTVGVEEYGDLQSDAQGETFGVLKRAYAYIQDGHWTLFTGYKVGSLISEWIGQAQFDPQVVGFVEGSPPVPSENLTAGQMNPNTMNWADFGEMVSMEFVESDQVSYSLGSTTESSNSVAFDASVKAKFDADFMVSIAPFGFGSIFKALEVKGKVGVKGHFASQGGWSNEASLGTSLSRSRALTVRMGGSWESPDTSEHLNPALGRRLIPSNVGFALVQSETADVFALRLAHNQRLVSFRMLPNPDIPKDWNLISFPLNPRYSKQGSLDGRVGYDAAGAVVYDPDYTNASGYGEYSYYKPREAYAIKRRIRQAEQDRLHYFATLGGGQHRRGDIGESAGKAATQLLKNDHPDAVALMEQARAGTGNRKPSRELPARHARRDLANTYVWTADGGFYSETTSTTDVRTETASGSFSFNSSMGAKMGLDVKVFGVGVGMEFEAAMGGGLSSSRTRTKESEKTFEINLNLDVPGDLQRYERNSGGDWVADGTNFPGKVDAYRFMTFYLDAAKENFEDLFGKVIDPIWLAQSDAPNAAALRQANQKGKQPACWRIFHRVTFVSRILPEFADPTSAPLEAAMKSQNLSSNWQLIQRLEPFVKNKTGDAVMFADAVRAALKRELPELTPHADAVVQFLNQYYGVA